MKSDDINKLRQINLTQLHLRYHKSQIIIMNLKTAEGLMELRSHKINIDQKFKTSPKMRKGKKFKKQSHEFNITKNKS